MMTPALRKLGETYDIDMVLPKYHEVFYNLAYIKNLFSFENQPFKEDYDNVIDLGDYEYNYERIFQPNNITKSKIELFADALKVNINNNKLDIKLSEDEMSWVKNLLSEFNLENKKKILIAIKSTSKSRDWSLENWKILIEKLKKLHYRIIIVDKELKWDDKEIVFFTNLNIRKLFALTSKVDYVICNDSGVLHIAGAFEISTLGIFGPTDPKFRCLYKNSHWITNNLNIAPCWFEKSKNVDYFSTITTEAVERKILEVIENGWE